MAKAKEAPVSGLHIDLSDAQEFADLPPGWYVMRVAKAEIRELGPPSASNPNRALPEGAPYLNIGLATTDENEVGPNRWAFSKFWLPPGELAPDYPPEKSKVLLGMLLGFLHSCGYDKDELRAGGFDLENNIDDLIDRELEVSIGFQKDSEDRTEVKSTRPLTAQNLSDL